MVKTLQKKKYLKETKEKHQRVIKNYNEYFTEEKAMSYLDKNLDSYYQDFYKDEVVGNLDKTKEDDEVISSINNVRFSASLIGCIVPIIFLLQIHMQHSIKNCCVWQKTIHF